MKKLYVERQKALYQSTLDNLDKSLEQKDLNLHARKQYERSYIECKIQLINQLAGYNRYTFYVSLLNSSENGYRRLRRSEEMTLKLESQFKKSEILSEYNAKLNSRTILPEEVEKVLQELNELNRKIQLQNDKLEYYSFAENDQLYQGLLNEFTVADIEQISQLSKTQSPTPLEEAIYNSFETKEKYQALMSILTQYKTINKQSGDTSLPSKLPRYCPEYIKEQISKLVPLKSESFVATEEEYRRITVFLLQLESKLKSFLIFANNFSDPQDMEDLKNLDSSDLKKCYDYFSAKLDSNKAKLYFYDYDSYMLFRERVFRTESVKQKIAEYKEKLKQTNKSLINDLEEQLISEFKQAIKLLSIQLNSDVFGLSDIATNSDIFIARCKSTLKFLNLLITEYTHKMNDCDKEKKVSKENMENRVDSLSKKSGVKLPLGTDLSLSQADCISIFEKTFLIKQINAIDEDVEKTLLGDYGKKNSLPTLNP